MLYALMNEDFTVARYIDASVNQIEWGGAYHSNLSLMTPGERRYFRIFEVIERNADRPEYSVLASEDTAVNSQNGTVTRTYHWQDAPVEEVQAAKVKAIDEAAMWRLSTTDRLALRNVERCLRKAGLLDEESLALADEREAIRAESNAIGAEIMAATTVSALRG